MSYLLVTVILLGGCNKINKSEAEAVFSASLTVLSDLRDTVIETEDASKWMV